LDTDHIRFRRDPSIVSQEIAGEVILVPVRKNVGELESIYTLNETAARAWTLFDGHHTMEDIQKILVAEYVVDADQARQDLLELVDQLQKIGAIVGG
jgi:hypothetical protein